MNRRALVLAALAAAPMSAAQLARRLKCNIDVVYPTLGSLMHTGEVTRLPHCRYDDVVDGRSVTFYCLPGAEAEPLEEADEPPRVRALNGSARVAKRPKAAGSGVIAGPCFARGFANWGMRR